MNLKEILELNEKLREIINEFKKEDAEPELNYGNKTYSEIVEELFDNCRKGYFGGSIPNIIPLNIMDKNVIYIY